MDKEKSTDLVYKVKVQIETFHLRIHNSSPWEISYATSGSSGLDLRANFDFPRIVDPGRRWKIPTGIRVEIPEGLEGQVRGRSGLFINHGISVLAGTIDSDYRGELSVLVINLGHDGYKILPGDRIGQLIISPVVRCTLDLVADKSDLQPTDRGAHGFGSTGR